jgi:prolyl oligopeptidase
MPRPPATRRDEVVELLHGEQVADPYRWLEDTESAETKAWITAQNGLTAGYLAAIPQRAAIRARLAALSHVTKWGPPHPRGDRWFFVRHDAGADQPGLFVADEPTGDGEMLLDPNSLSRDGTVALSQWAVSRDGSRVAYALSESGSDWMTWRVRQADGGEDLPDVVKWSKWFQAVWLPDASGFVYSAQDAPTPGREYLEGNDQNRLALHLIGQAASSDAVVFSPDDAGWSSHPDSVGDGRWLVITSESSRGPETKLYVADLSTSGISVQPLLPNPDCRQVIVGNDGDTFYVLTDADAPRRRVVAVDLEASSRPHWREIVPEGPDVIRDVTEAGDCLVVHVLHDASSVLQVWTKAGERLADVPLPGCVTVTEVTADKTSVVWIGLTSFTDPASVWCADVRTGEMHQVRSASAPIDAAGLTVSRATATSTDGTAVPMFLLHRRDVVPTGEVPTLLYGYGGFDIALTPEFNASRLVWAERGGVAVVANLRGGGEFGKEWYDAGRLASKQNVFDDFAGCARWLASSGWSRPERIAINGGSNGGLLVGAVLTQHPELIGAAVPEVGVMDMLRYHRFTIGWSWMCDLGDPDDPEQYRWVRAYSPLHNIRPGTAYPATLVMTSDHDDRVVPGHSFKFTAALQAAQSGDAPVLIRVEMAAGHGAGTPVSKLVDARADMLAFCESALGVD